MRADTEFIDNRLEPVYVYIYRIQAWNAVGRTSWDTVDISSKQKNINPQNHPIIQMSVDHMTLLINQIFIFFQLTFNIQ